jgi:DNA-binding MarR family transcriptional regulator
MNQLHGLDPDAWRAALERLAELDAAAVPLRAFLQLSRSEFQVLLVLWQRGGATMSDVAARVDLSRTTLTALTDRLELRGLVERRRDPHDRRRIHLAATQRFERQLNTFRQQPAD